MLACMRMYSLQRKNFSPPLFGLQSHYQQFFVGFMAFGQATTAALLADGNISNDSVSPVGVTVAMSGLNVAVTALSMIKVLVDLYGALRDCGRKEQLGVRQDTADTLLAVSAEPLLDAIADPQLLRTMDRSLDCRSPPTNPLADSDDL